MVLAIGFSAKPGGSGRRRAQPTEFVADFQWPGPEPVSARHHRAAEAVDRDQRADLQPVRRHRAGAAEPASPSAKASAVSGSPPSAASISRSGSRGLSRWQDDIGASSPNRAMYALFPASKRRRRSRLTSLSEVMLWPPFQSQHGGAPHAIASTAC